MNRRTFELVRIAILMAAFSALMVAEHFWQTAGLVAVCAFAFGIYAGILLSLWWLRPVQRKATR